MRAGNLKHRIIIQTEDTPVDDYGDPLPSEWKDFKSLRASVIPMKSKEKFISNTDFNKTLFTVRIRYTSGINASQRIKWGDRILDIIDVINISEMNKTIELICEEESNGY